MKVSVREIGAYLAFLSEFTRLLIAALAVLGLGLLIATFFQVRFGLRPLRAIRQKLAEIRSGEAEKLEDKIRDEIRPLQQELNALIQSNREIVERARTHVGNLAHALKIPLSVMSNEARTHKARCPTRWWSKPKSCAPRSRIISIGRG
jgi:signal transduction histidine kinase